VRDVPQATLRGPRRGYQRTVRSKFTLASARGWRLQGVWKREVHAAGADRRWDGSRAPRLHARRQPLLDSSFLSDARDGQALRATERGRGSMVCVESCSDGPRAICRILQVPPLTPLPLFPGAICPVRKVPTIPWQQMPVKRISLAKMACAQRQTRARVGDSALGFRVERLRWPAHTHGTRVRGLEFG
jgi:hypothetical protein